MRACALRLLILAFAAGFVAIIAQAFSPQAAGSGDFAVEIKVNQLLAEMSPQEKIRQRAEQKFSFSE